MRISKYIFKVQKTEEILAQSDWMKKEVLYERKSQFVVVSKIFRDGVWNILLEEK